MDFSFYGCCYKPQSEGKIIGGGVPVGERALVLIFDAESNEELDIILQRLPLWGWQGGK
jgi:muconolactone delta-isomerase